MTYGPPEEGNPGNPGMEEEPEAGLELSAAKDAMAAKSPEEWIEAMKAFLEACYPSLAKEGSDSTHMMPGGKRMSGMSMDE